MEKLKKLLDYQKEISNIQYTLNLLRWELKISTPEKAEQDLIDLITNYESKLFELQTSDYYGELLNEVVDDQEFKNIEEAERRYICKLLRNYEDNKKVPSDFYAKYMELRSKSNVVWKNAKEQNNYQMFKPYLEQIIEMTKQYYRYIDSESDNLYDVMLNQYETGMTSDVIDRLFDELKKRLLPMIPKGSEQVIPNNRYSYTNQELIDCAQFLLEYIGFDLKKGTLGIYPHGYTEKMCSNDIRIAFRNVNDPFDFLTTITHEGGHAIFEQNISDNLSRYENVTIDNLYALHESQSRFYENILGRNINFWIPIYDEISKRLRLDRSLSEFVEILNHPVPNVKRIESDELTYCMHIILRYEIERAIFNEGVSLDDLPSLWNQKMKDYLGIEVKNDSDGLMQDIHWSEGDFGYFPSYLLGTIYDGMFMQAVEKDLGNLDELLKAGRVKDITDYLINNIYKNGAAYTSSEIINRMCNSEISVDPIVNYFEKKYAKTK
ncbi:MAG: carboxypeptidase M32 [Erysipelotrichales bacterium]|nr:carboxypeptidase M32 [Erysipelotrichales bacterium]